MTSKTTLASTVSFLGVGLHTGKRSRITIFPQAEGGVRFRQKNVDIPATLPFLTSATFGMKLSHQGESVLVVEHLLSALHALRISEALIEIDGPEVPILDGSSKPFLDSFLSAGIIEVEGEANEIGVNELVSVSEGDASLTAIPGDNFEVYFRVDFDHPMVGEQHWHGIPLGTTYIHEIAGARTFGFERDRDLFKRAGLGIGVGMDNTVIYTENGLFEGQQLRFTDEAVRHKVLDIVGDLFLLGAFPRFKLIAVKSGHRHNARLVGKILDGLGVPNRWAI